MKRILGFVLVFCLVFSLVAEAVAAPKWEITQQTKSETNDKKKTVTLSVKVKGKGTIKYQWVFVNPENPEDTVTGKKLSKDSRFKGIKVSNPTKSKITLSKVPEALQGWTVYCHLYSTNAYTLDTEPVMIRVPGMEEPTQPAKASSAKEDKDKASDEDKKTDNAASDSKAESKSDSKTDTKSESKTDTKAESKTDDKAESKESGEAAAKTEEKAAEDQAEAEEDDNDEGITTEAPKEFTVTASGDYLYPLNSMGKLQGEAGVSSLKLAGTGNIAVSSENPIKSVTVNGVRYEPESPVKVFKLFNLTEDTSVSVKLAPKSAASANVDESISCKVTCTGCSFTYMPKGLKSVKEGNVPSGAVIYVFADSSDTAANGYSVNGGEIQDAGASSIQVTVTGDTTIVVK